MAGMKILCVVAATHSFIYFTARIILETDTNLWIVDGRKPQRIMEAITKMRTIGTNIIKNNEKIQ